MPRATDGTPMHSLSRARHHDKMMAGKKSGTKAVTEPPKGDGADKPEHEMSNESIHDVVKEHGPAHHIEYEHDKESDKHHVHSKHGEANHEHHSVHDTSEEAHDHMAAAMGHEEPDEDDEELGEEAGEAMPAMEHAGRIPGMA